MNLTFVSSQKRYYVFILVSRSNMQLDYIIHAQTIPNEF